MLKLLFIFLEMPHVFGQPVTEETLLMVIKLIDHLKLRMYIIFYFALVC